MATKKKQPKFSATQLAKLQFAQLKNLLPKGKIEHGSHDVRPDGTPEGVCVMEAVAWVAGEEHSDHPKCACPLLTEIAINVNDSTTQEGRQKLIHAIPALVGSKSGSKRVYFRRAKTLAKHLFAKAMEDTAVDTDTAAKRLLSERLKKILGQVPTEALLDEALQLNAALDELGSYDVIDEDVKTKLEQIRDNWNSTGISYDQYDEIFNEDNLNLVSLFGEDGAPEVFVDIATQRAN